MQMIVTPKVRGFICTVSHPKGCVETVKRQMDYVKQTGTFQKDFFPKKRVLIIGSSMGYGLSSRITAAFGMGASTLGVCYERAPEGSRTASAGWYHTYGFHKYAASEDLYAKTINGDAFSDEVKAKTVKMIKKDLGKVDLVIYSLASPKRVDPITQEVYRSTLKPIGEVFSDKTVNTTTGEVTDMTVLPASEDEIKHTIKVMGGEDWYLWMQALKAEDVLEHGVITVAYSYLGPELTHPIYRSGTIGKAKEDLEMKTNVLNEFLMDIKGKAYISINKALVTQASAAIPVLPLYIAILFKVMKQQSTHEGCIEQMVRLFAEKLYRSEEKSVLIEEKTQFIRLDEHEMEPSVQSKVNALWQQVNSENIFELTDLKGYQQEFLNLFGFGYDVVDYTEAVNLEVPLNMLS